MRLLFYWLVGGMAVFQISGAAQAQTSLCRSFTDFADESNKTFPTKADAMTDNIRMDVDCEEKRVVFVKRLTVRDPKFRSGWRGRHLLRHHMLHCNRVGLASRHQWTVETEMQQMDAKPLTTLRTTPGDCKTL